MPMRIPSHPTPPPPSQFPALPPNPPQSSVPSIPKTSPHPATLLPHQYKPSARSPHAPPSQTQRGPPMPLHSLNKNIWSANRAARLPPPSPSPPHPPEARKRIPSKLTSSLLQVLSKPHPADELILLQRLICKQ